MNIMTTIAAPTVAVAAPSIATGRSGGGTFEDDPVFAAIETHRVALQRFKDAQNADIALDDSLELSITGEPCVKVPFMCWKPFERKWVEMDKAEWCYDEEGIAEMVPACFKKRRRKAFMRKWIAELEKDARRRRAEQDRTGWTATRREYDEAWEALLVARTALALELPTTAEGSRAQIKYWTEFSAAELEGSGRSVEWEHMQDTLRLLTSVYGAIGTIAAA